MAALWAFKKSPCFGGRKAIWASGLRLRVAQGRRIILGAFDGELLVGTVSLVLDLLAEPAPSRRCRKDDDASESSRARDGQGAYAGA